MNISKINNILDEDDFEDKFNLLNELTIDYLYLLLVHKNFWNSKEFILYFLNRKESLEIIEKILKADVQLPKCILTSFYFGLHILKRSRDDKNDLFIRSFENFSFDKIDHMSFHNKHFLLIFESLKYDIENLSFFEEKFNKKVYEKIIISIRNSFKLLAHVKKRLFHYQKYYSFFKNIDLFSSEIEEIFHIPNVKTIIVQKNVQEDIDPIRIDTESIKEDIDPIREDVESIREDIDHIRENIDPIRENIIVNKKSNEYIGTIGDSYYYSKNMKDIYGTLRYLEL